MSRQQKKAIVLVAVVAALFAVAVVIGLGGGEAGYSDAATFERWQARLQGLVRPQSFGVRDTRGCRTGDAFLLRVGENCTVTIPADSAPVRIARLVLDEGLEAVAELDQPGSVRQREVLAAGEAAELEVFKPPAKRPEEGARLRLQCLQGSNGRCVLRLRKPDEGE
jgi:hypothetical protein